jgi:hypothetical protein
LIHFSAHERYEQLISGSEGEWIVPGGILECNDKEQHGFYVLPAVVMVSDSASLDASSLAKGAENAWWDKATTTPSKGSWKSHPMMASEKSGKFVVRIGTGMKAFKSKREAFVAFKRQGAGASGNALIDTIEGTHQPSNAIVYRDAIAANKPVSAVAVDAYKIKLPEGWEQRGDLWYPPASTSGEALPPTTSAEVVPSEEETPTPVATPIPSVETTPEETSSDAGLTATEKVTKYGRLITSKFAPFQKTLDELGIVTNVKIVSDDYQKYPINFNVDQKLFEINPIALVRAVEWIQKNSPPGYSIGEYFDRMVEEEVDHALTSEFSNADPKNRRSIELLAKTEKDIGAELEKEYPDWDAKSDWAKGSEIFQRILAARRNPDLPRPTTES